MFTATPRWIALLLIVEGLLAFAPLIVMAPAIGWPASLGLSPAEQLVAIAARPQAVHLGYSLYLAYSILILPAMAGLLAQVNGGGWDGLGLGALGFAAASMLARCIGILRWLTIQPLLAAQYAGAAPEQRAALELAFGVVHEYGGGVGELLGVSLFMAASLGLAMLLALRQRSLPRWLAYSGLLAAAGLIALSLPAFGAPVEVPIAVVISYLSLWMLACGVWSLLGARRVQAELLLTA